MAYIPPKNIPPPPMNPGFTVKEYFNEEEDMSLLVLKESILNVIREDMMKPQHYGKESLYMNYYLHRDGIVNECFAVGVSCDEMLRNYSLMNIAVMIKDYLTFYLSDKGLTHFNITLDYQTVVQNVIIKIELEW